MLRRTLPALACCALVALALAPALAPPRSASEPAAAPGRADDPAARARWELARLADPATGRIPDGIRARELAFASTIPTALKDAALAPAWTPRGPYQLGGRTRALAVDVTDSNTLLAGGVSGGMWRSTDGGTTWAKTTGNDQLHSITAVVQDPRPGHTATWYASSGEYRGNSASYFGDPFRGDGIFKSVDGGRSWAPLEATVSGTPQSADSPFDYVWELAVDPSNAARSEVYAATWQGIYRSVDGGASWTRVLAAANAGSNTRPDVAVTPSGRVYAALNDDSEAYYTSPDGVTWTEITPSSFPTGLNRAAIAIDPSDENRVWFLGDHAENYSTLTTSLYRYNHATGTFANRSSTLRTATGGLQAYLAYCLEIAVHPSNPDVIYVAGLRIYRTTDAFATSTQTQPIGQGHADVHRLVFDPQNPSRLFTGTDGGVHRTDLPLSTAPFWASLNNGYTTSQFYHAAIRPEGDNLAGGLQDNGTWLATGPEAPQWYKIAGGDGAFVAWTAVPRQIVTSYQNGFLTLRSFDAGWNQTAQRDVTPSGASGFAFINPISIDPVDRRALYTIAGTALWRNPDVTSASGLWSSVLNVAPANLSAVEASGSEPQRVWVGSKDGHLIRVDNALAGTPTLTDVRDPAMPAGYISAIATHPTDGDVALAVFSSYGVVSLFYTADAGASWSAVGGALEENPDGTGAGPSVRDAAILPFPDGSTGYFAATSTGLYATDRLQGASTPWRAIGADEIGRVVIDAVDVRVEDGLVAVATHGAGLFSATFSAAPTPTDPGPEGASFALSAPYPNPFSAGTRLALRADAAGPARVEVFDARGRRVALLHDGPLAAGTTTYLQLDGTALTSGRYVVRATGPSGTQTQTATLVR